MSETPETFDVLVHCPLCRVEQRTGLQVSPDANNTFQGMSVRCSQCRATIHFPDLHFASGATPAAIDQAQMRSEFDSLLRAAKAKNPLYLLLLHTNWQDTGRMLQYMLEVNHLTASVIAKPPGGEAPRPVGAEAMLFVLVANLEAKAFYAYWRNVVSILVGRLAAPHPWDKTKDEMAYDSRRDRLNLKTGRIIDNLISDLSVAKFSYLSNEFSHTHTGLATIIRNGVSHACFLTPSEATGGVWCFGDFTLNTAGKIEAVDHLIEHEHLVQYFRRFLTFRLAAMQATQAFNEWLQSQTVAFVGENQMTPGERLDCTWDRGKLEIRGYRTPLW